MGDSAENKISNNSHGSDSFYVHDFPDFALEQQVVNTIKSIKDFSFIALRSVLISKLTKGSDNTEY